MNMVEFYSSDICEKSFSELVAFARKANELGESPLLFGGWAVYHYNSYAGSKDVDCIVSNDRFNKLVDYLVGKGYGQRELPEALKKRKVSLRNDTQALGLVTKPTKIKLKNLNDKIRLVVNGHI